MALREISHPNLSESYSDEISIAKTTENIFFRILEILTHTGISLEVKT